MNIVKPEWPGDIIISGTEHNEVEIQYVNLADTYKHYIGILPCFSDHISLMSIFCI